MPANDHLPTAGPDVLIVLPGTGSDGDFVRRAFGPAAHDLGVDLIGIEPTDDLIGGHRRRLAELSASCQRVLVGGFSIGAALALEWALSAPGRRRCVGVWAAMPAWSGDPDEAIAARSAAITASALRSDGLEQTLATMVATSPSWLARELTRSWRALYPGLVDQLDAASRYRAPAAAAIGNLVAPLAVTAAHDDPLHPWQVAQDWCRAAPNSRLTGVGLADWGADPALLGRLCADAWRALITGSTQTDDEQHDSPPHGSE